MQSGSIIKLSVPDLQAPAYYRSTGTPPGDFEISCGPLSKIYRPAFETSFTFLGKHKKTKTYYCTSLVPSPVVYKFKTILPIVKAIPASVKPVSSAKRDLFIVQIMRESDKPHEQLCLFC